MLYLVHHGIKGQKWGVRRYQNPDGTLTPEGLAKYRKIEYPSEQKRTNTMTRAIAVGGATGGSVGGALGALAGGAAGALVGAGINASQKRAYRKATDALNAHQEALDNDSQTLARLKKEGSRLEKGGADAYLSESKRLASSSLHSDYSRLASDPDTKAYLQRNGMTSPKKFESHVINGTKLFELADGDRPISQHIDVDYRMITNGYISKNTYNKLYSAEIYRASTDSLRWHRGIKEFDSSVKWAKQKLREVPKDRRSDLFDDDQMSFLRKQGVYD